MLKIMTKTIFFAAAVFGVATAASAQELPPGIETFETWSYVGADRIRACDASACFTFWNTGNNFWVIVSVEPRPFPGGRHEN